MEISSFDFELFNCSRMPLNIVLSRIDVELLAPGCQWVVPTWLLKSGKILGWQQKGLE